jgi:hypothetical protein
MERWKGVRCRRLLMRGPVGGGGDADNDMEGVTEAYRGNIMSF